MIRSDQVFVKILVLMLFMPGASWAHSIKARMDHKAIVVHAVYDGGESIAAAKVTVSRPDEKTVFQTGRTDRNGRFCFFPDTLGDWHVVVDDEIGHRLEIKVLAGKEQISEEGGVSIERPGSGSLRFQKAIMGLCLIFGFSGIFFWWRAKKKYTSV